MKKGKFLFSLYKNDLKTMSEVLYRATKYMNAEDALLAREERPRLGRIKAERRQEWEIEGMRGALSPWGEDSRASLR